VHDTGVLRGSVWAPNCKLRDSGVVASEFLRFQVCPCSLPWGLSITWDQFLLILDLFVFGAPQHSRFIFQGRRSLRRDSVASILFSEHGELPLPAARPCATWNFCARQTVFTRRVQTLAKKGLCSQPCSRKTNTIYCIGMLWRARFQNTALASL